MNAARKLIAFVRDAAQRVSGQLEYPECTAADLVDARRTIAHMRADLDECDQRIRAEIDRRVKRRDPLTPPIACTMREVEDYERRLVGGRADGAEDELLASIACDRAVEPAAPHPLMPRFRPTHRFSPQLRRLLPLSPALSSPGRPAR